MLSSRHERMIDLLTRIVQEYIVSGHPVGSLALSGKHGLSISAATIRNLMAGLEEEGYMYQPHTSAGRVPTREGFRVYIQNMKPARVSRRTTERLARIVHDARTLLSLKEFVRSLAALCGEIVFIALESQAVYYTGFSVVLAKHEFSEIAYRAALAHTLDSLDETLQHIRKSVGNDPAVFIGREDICAPLCSVLMVQFRARSEQGILGILGSVRMDYARNVSLLKHAQSIINDVHN